MSDYDKLSEKDLRLLRLLAEHGPGLGPELAKAFWPDADDQSYWEYADSMDRAFSRLLELGLVDHQYAVLRIPLDHWDITVEGMAALKTADAKETAAKPGDPVLSKARKCEV